MAKKGMPGLPPGMPDPEAIFESWWPFIIAIGGGIIYAIRQYFRGARCMSPIKLDGKVAIVTGGNEGIGRHVAEDFAKRGAKVYLACRDVKSGEEAAAEIQTKTSNKKVHCLACDLSSFKSIRSFVSAFKKKEESLHLLINNAGVMMCPFKLTEDKFEEQFQVNYLGTVLLTHLLLDLMKKSGPARIVNTAAAAFALGVIDFEDINSNNKEYNPANMYSQSKMAVVQFTLELAEQLKDTEVTVNVVNPGVVKTRIHRHMAFQKSWLVSVTFSPFLWFLMKTADDGAQHAIFCSVAEALKTVSGEYYKECKKENIDKYKNQELQETLWLETLRWLSISEFGTGSEDEPQAIKQSDDEEEEEEEDKKESDKE